MIPGQAANNLKLNNLRLNANNNVRMSSTSTQHLVITGDVMSSEIAFDTSSDNCVTSGQKLGQEAAAQGNYNCTVDAEMSCIDIEDKQEPIEDQNPFQRAEQLVGEPQPDEEVKQGASDTGAAHHNSSCIDACMPGSDLVQGNMIEEDFGLLPPSAKLSREKTTEIERQNYNVNCEYGDSIMNYTRELEEKFLTNNSLIRHKITPALRARMIDWKIEVLTNFKCDDQTFFLAVNLMDRYFKGKQETREISDLHIIGVTCMFIASKYEDIYPLKMRMVYEKIAHQKLAIADIKALELDIL